MKRSRQRRRWPAWRPTTAATATASSNDAESDLGLGGGGIFDARGMKGIGERRGGIRGRGAALEAAVWG